MANIEDVADIIVNYMNTKDEPYISNLMLNKLLYFAQGHCLAETGEPLFADDFEAWKYGPVVSRIYNKYKMCGKNNIYPTNDNIKENDVLDWEQQPIVDDVLEQYSVFSPSKLVSITHEKGSPWDSAIRENKYPNNRILIKKDDMQSYFQTIPLGDDLLELSDETMQSIIEYEKQRQEGTLELYSLEDFEEDESNTFSEEEINEILDISKAWHEGKLKVIKLEDLG